MRSSSTTLAVRFMLALATCLLFQQVAAGAERVPDDAIASIDGIVAEGIDQKKAASYAVGVVKDGRLILARGYGFADLENEVPATAETVYRLGSITKQFTALAIMQLAEQGKLSVDDDLTKFLPDYPTAGHKVTVHHLLNHTSGIQSYTIQPDFRKVTRQDLSHEELLARFKDKPFDFEPGAKWQYNNSGYYLLGMIIEKVSGKSYGDYLEEHVFRPLNMSATRYGHMRSIIPHRAAGYRLEDGQLANDDAMSMNPPGAAGALVSNVLDLIKWHQALEAGDLLSSSSYETMYRATKLADGSTHPYGYGWGLGELGGHRKLSHGGGINGFSTMIARYPDDRLAVIVLSNTAGANVGAVESRISKLLLGVEDKPDVDLPIDKELADRLIGKYAIGDLKVEVTFEDGKLYGTLDGEPKDRLRYQGKQEFVSSNDSNLRITFRPDGKQAEGFDVDSEGQKLTGSRAD